MANASDQSPVVYYFADPRFAWDIGAPMADVERRGLRVVKGDNADELLFLLQMGRPAAIVYTLAPGEARVSGSFQMVAQRAIDMLVPMVVVGPEDPRDGVLLRYPVGREVEERHVPLHALGDLFAEFDASPPSTPSRPAPFVHAQTFGKGRTMMAIRRSLPPEERRSDPPEQTPVDEAPLVEPTKPAAKSSREEEPVVRVRAEDAEETAPKPKSWKLAAALGGGVAIGLAALVVYFVHARGKTFSTPERSGDVRSADPERLARPHAATTIPAPGVADAGEREENAATGDSGRSERARRVRASEPRATSGQQELLAGTTGVVRFPGHFRNDSATFWFAGDWEERRFLDLVRSMGPSTVIRLIGHATDAERAEGQAVLALGRARAVEKYLVRKGIPEARIETESGPPVRAASDLDARGWPRNRWVDVKFGP